HGKMKEIADRFQVCRKTITNIWKEVQKQREQGLFINMDSKLKGKKGNKKLVFDVEAFKEIDFNSRTTTRRLATAMSVTQTAVARWLSDGPIKSHTNAIKPGLSDANKVNRLIFCLSKLHFDDVCSTMKFNDQTNLVHIDEKWFYMTKSCQRYYVTDSEQTPYRCVQSKKFIPKIMFMCVVARPLYTANGDCIFDGKSGFFHLLHRCQQREIQRIDCAGTLKTKPIESINKAMIKDRIINVVLPAIKAKWSDCLSKQIVIQQDNAKPHISNSDPDFRAAATSDGFNIELQCQPPNSPDLKTGLKLPHMNKSKHARQGQLPNYLSADIELVKDSIGYVQSIGINKLVLTTFDQN
ncbi:hypothetical protein RND81_13G063900, partial [Saponaria officinalis]